MTALANHFLETLRSLFPGLLLIAVVTAAAFHAHSLPGLVGLSPVILAILLGMTYANVVGVNEACGPGIDFCARRLMRTAVALLGAQITVGDLMSFGWQGLVAIAAAVAVTLPVSYAVGRKLGVARDLSMLIATGSAVCGASAIAGVNTVIRAREDSVSYAVAVITLWGTVGLFAVPLLSDILGLSAVQAGLWAGLSLHEVAQAVGAGFAGGDASGHAAVAMKLGRVLMLAVVIFALARAWRQSPGTVGERPRAVPEFLIAFLALCGLNSLGLLPDELRSAAVVATPLLLAASMAGLGMNTRFASLRALGHAPLWQGAVTFAVISALGLLAAVWISDSATARTVVAAMPVTQQP
ncbi:YeiH family protein [Pararhodobacter zhoushanensis]|uniref:Sulfate exporter family transporter n=1 Tax=Pararhodobacter zhoushanensis TaxID=2479545 RepID=A0ABT3GU25_9RHOB|nr:putative sulfate exporter family transporter [Pararhodobacter zhoushanensis]MCW1931036.1 putative sulfate exporter family transporter [Pararhodobacter zhoushanensis]